MQGTEEQNNIAGTRVSHGTIRLRKLVYAMGVWILLIPLAITNAAFRESLIVPVIGEYWGHITSTVTFISGLSIVTYLYFGRYTDYSLRELVAVGVIWPVSTVVFEFSFGHYVMHHSWDVLLSDYDVFSGRVWAFVPLSMAVLPLIFGRYLKN